MLGWEGDNSNTFSEVFAGYPCIAYLMIHVTGVEGKVVVRHSRMTIAAVIIQSVCDKW